MQLNFVGFGEAGRAFAPVIGGSIPVRPSAFDIKTDQAETREEMSRAYKQHGISGCASLPEGLSGADLVLSLVTADQAAVVARDSAGKLQSGRAVLRHEQRLAANQASFCQTDRLQGRCLCRCGDHGAGRSASAGCAAAGIRSARPRRRSMR